MIVQTTAHIDNSNEPVLTTASIIMDDNQIIEDDIIISDRDNNNNNDNNDNNNDNNDNNDDNNNCWIKIGSSLILKQSENDDGFIDVREEDDNMI